MHSARPGTDAHLEWRSFVLIILITFAPLLFLPSSSSSSSSPSVVLANSNDAAGWLRVGREVLSGVLRFYSRPTLIFLLKNRAAFVRNGFAPARELASACCPFCMTPSLRARVFSPSRERKMCRVRWVSFVRFFGQDSCVL